jgi:hypothetical protein
MKKKIPTFENDAEAEWFVDTADLSQYDLSGLKPVQYEFEKKKGPSARGAVERAVARPEKTR